MPAVTVHAPVPADQETISRCLAAITERLAAALQQEPSTVRAHWVPTVDPGGPTGRTPDGAMLVIRARAGRHGGVIQQGLRAAAEATAESLSCPLANVWVHWEEFRPGRSFAGGGIR